MGGTASTASPSPCPGGLHMVVIEWTSGANLLSQVCVLYHVQHAVQRDCSKTPAVMKKLRGFRISVSSSAGWATPFPGTQKRGFPPAAETLSTVVPVQHLSPSIVGYHWETGGVCPDILGDNAIYLYVVVVGYTYSTVHTRSGSRLRLKKKGLCADPTVRLKMMKKTTSSVEPSRS